MTAWKETELTDAPCASDTTTSQRFAKIRKLRLANLFLLASADFDLVQQTLFRSTFTKQGRQRILRDQRRSTKDQAPGNHNPPSTGQAERSRAPLYHARTTYGIHREKPRSSKQKISLCQW